MKATQFFRQLWRINGVLIFLVALLAVLVLGCIAIQFLDFGRHAAKQVVRVDQQTQEKAEPPILGAFQTVSGTPFMRAALTFGDEYARSSFSSSAGSYSTRNYLFLNPETLEGRWLFPDNKQLIVDSDELRENLQPKDSDTPKFRTTAFFYKMIDTDTNGDKQLTPEDKLSIAYSRPDGREYTTVLKGVDRILGSASIDNGRKHVVVYEIEKKWCTAVISLSTFEIERKGELPTR